MQTPDITRLQETLLIGHSLPMSILENRTYALWRGFMPNLQQIPGRVGTDLYSVEVYPSDYFQGFDPNRTFRKWAAVPVDPKTPVPDGFERLLLPEGTYAVFNYRGRMGPISEFYRWIYTDWVPNSGATLDNRPHLAVMDKDYRPDDPDAWERLWIPLAPTK